MANDDVIIIDVHNKPNQNSSKTTTTTSSSSGAPQPPAQVPRVAKKSTGTFTEPKPTEQRMVTRRRNPQLRKLTKDGFIQNFDPERSVREKRKLTRKIAGTSTTRRVPGALYDEHGIHVTSGTDLCDCLQIFCAGCHFPCLKCKSQKCGNECRVNRKFIYEQIEYNGCDISIRNPLGR